MSSWDGGGRSSLTRGAFRSSRWDMARWPRRSNGGEARPRAGSSLSGRKASRSGPIRTARSASWGPRPRWRSRRRWARTSPLRSTNARPSTPTGTTRPARWSEPTGGSTAARTGTRRMVQAGRRCSGSCRAGCTRTFAQNPRPGWGRRPSTESPSVARSDRRRRRCGRGGAVGLSLRGGPDERPPHLLGIGDVDDILHAVGAGIDMFDCATPTRLARHGTALGPDPGRRWRLDLTKSEHRLSREPIAQGCPCPACREHTRAYLHYLLRAGELTGKRLITVHNLTFMAELMQGIRAAIGDGRYAAHADAVLAGTEPY